MFDINLSPKAIKFILIAVGVVAFGLLLSKLYKDTIGKYKPRKVKLPSGGLGIPTNSNGQPWSPLKSVELLYQSMHGSLTGYWFDPTSLGTDEEQLFNAIGDKTDDQLAAILNAYEQKYNRDLIADLNSELSGAELSTALDYFSFVTA